MALSLRSVVRALGKLLPWSVAATLLAFTALCWFCWPSADDYAIAHQVDARGYLDAQWFWYQEWTGKFVGLAAMSGFVAVFGLVELYALAPALILVATFVALWSAARLLVPAAAPPRAAALAALLLTAVVLANVPAPQETTYWLTGAYAYQVGVLFSLVLVGLLSRRPRGRARSGLHAVGCFFAAVAAAGCVETLMLPYLVVAAGWFGLVVLRRERCHPAALAAALGVAVAAAVMVLAPGNAVRGAAFAESHDLLRSVQRSVSRGAGRAAQWSLSPSMLGAALLCAPALVAVRARWRAASPTLHLALGVPFALGAVMLAHFPAYWAMGAPPPPRAVGAIWGLFALAWFLVLAPAAAAALARWSPPAWCERRALGRALLGVGLLVWGNVPAAAVDLFGGEALAYRRACAARHAASLRAAARGAPLVAPPLAVRPETIFFADLHPDPAHIDNRNYASYYGLPSAAARTAP